MAASRRRLLHAHLSPGILHPGDGRRRGIRAAGAAWPRTALEVQRQPRRGGGARHRTAAAAGAGPSGQLSREPVHRGVHDRGLGRAPAVRLPRLQADPASGSGAVACRYRRGGPGIPGRGLPAGVRLMEPRPMRLPRLTALAAALDLTGPLLVLAQALWFVAPDQADHRALALTLCVVPGAFFVFLLVPRRAGLLRETEAPQRSLLLALTLG